MSAVQRSTLTSCHIRKVSLQVRKIDRKLTSCHNPLLDPASSQFQKAATEQQERKAKAKAEKVRLHLRCRKHKLCALA